MSTGELVFIGLGLHDELDISIKGFEEIKSAEKIFAEFYTSTLSGASLKKLQKKLGKKIHVLSREQTEKGDVVIDNAKSKKTVFLTCGDPMVATTHVDLRLRAIKNKIKTKLVHSSSIVTAAPGILGLQNYKFGRTTTLPIPEKDYFPKSPYTVIKDNKKIGLHTLVLLDIQAEKNVYMTANQGLSLLLEMEKKFKESVFNEESIVCVVAQAGSTKPVVRADKISVLINEDFGQPLHTLVIPGSLHFMEIDALQTLAKLPLDIGKKMQKL